MNMSRFCLIFVLFFLLTGCIRWYGAQPGSAPVPAMSAQQQTREYETGNKKAVLNAAIALIQDMGFQLDESSTETGVISASKKRDVRGTQAKIAKTWRSLVNVATLGLSDALGHGAKYDTHAATQSIKISLVVQSVDDNNSVTAKRVEQVQQKLRAVLYKGLRKKFPEETATKIADSMAQSTAKTFISDLDSLLPVSETPGRTSVRINFQTITRNEAGDIFDQKQVTDENIYREFFANLSQALFFEANNS